MNQNDKTKSQNTDELHPKVKEAIETIQDHFASRDFDLKGITFSFADNRSCHYDVNLKTYVCN